MAYKLDVIIGSSLDKTELKKAEAELNSFYNKYSNKKVSITSSAKSTAESTKALTKLNTGLKTATTTTQGYTGRVKEAIVAGSQWAIGMGVLYGSLRKIGEAVDFTVGVDEQLTQIAMVTEQTREQVQGLADDYLKLASTLKASNEEILEASVALYRQGLSAEEVEERLVQITKAAQTAGISVQEATKFVTVGINAMGYSAESFNDILLKTGAIAATDYQALGEMLQKSGASFANANIELEKATSWLAAVQETSQLASQTIGTAFKTIVARYSKVTEAGLDNTEILNDIAKAYDKAGISITDMSGQLRPIDTLIDELAVKWETLDTNTQNYIKTNVAGVRQGDVFLQLMNNYSRTMDIYSQNLESAGTTTEQYNKYLESLNAKLVDLENAWNRFYTALLNDESVGKILDIGILLVDTLTLLFDELGTGNVLLVATSGIIGGKLLPSVISTTSALTGMQLALLGVKTAGIAFAGVALYKIIDELIISTDEATENIQKLHEEINNTKNILGSVEELGEEYENLKDNTELTTEESERFKEVQNEIAEILPDMVGYYDENGDAVLRLSANYETVVENQKEYLDQLKEQQQAQAESGVRAISIDSDIRDRTLPAVTESIGVLEEQYKSGKITLAYYNTEMSILETSYYNLRNELIDSDDSLKEFGRTLLTTSDEWDALTDSQKQYALDAIDIIDTTSMTSEEFRVFRNNLIDATNQTLSFANSFGAIDKTGQVANSAVNDISQDTLALAEAQENFNSTLDSTISNLESLESIYKTVQDGEKLSLSTLYDLQQQYPELTNLIWKANDSKEAGLKLTEAINEVERANLIESTEIAQNEVENQLAQANARLVNLKVTQAMLKANAYANKESISEYAGISTTIYDLEQELDNLGVTLDAVLGYDYTSNWSDTSSSVSDVTEETEDLVDASEEYLELLEEQVNLQKELAQEAKDAMEDSYDDRIDSLNNELDALQESYETRISLEQESLDALEEESNELQNQQTIQEKLLALSEARKNLAEAQAQKSERTFTGKGWEWVADPTAVASAMEDLASAKQSYSEELATQEQEAKEQSVQNNIDELEKQQKIEEDALEARIDILELEKEAQQEYYTSIMESLDDLLTTQQSLYEEAKYAELDVIELLTKEYGEYSDEVTAATEALNNLKNIGLELESGIGSASNNTSAEATTFGNRDYSIGATTSWYAGLTEEERKNLSALQIARMGGGSSEAWYPWLKDNGYGEEDYGNQSLRSEFDTWYAANRKVTSSTGTQGLMNMGLYTEDDRIDFLKLDQNIQDSIIDRYNNNLWNIPEIHPETQSTTTSTTSFGDIYITANNGDTLDSLINEAENKAKTG